MRATDVQKYLWWVVGLALAVIVIFAGVLVLRNGNSSELLLEAIRFCGQILIVGVVGVITSVYLESRRQEYRAEERKRDKNRESREQKRTVILDMLQRLEDEYRRAKSVRRRLRVAGLTEKYGATPEICAEKLEEVLPLMEELNEIQLELERLKQESNDDFHAVGTADATKSLKRMEQYLHDALDDWTLAVRNARPDRVLQNKELRKILDFTADRSTCTEVEKLFQSHKSARKSLQAALSRLAS